MKVHIQLPKRLKYSKVNPLEDFYRKCLKSANIDYDLKKIQVWAFSVNKKEFKKLETLVTKHVVKNYPYLVYKKRKVTVGMIMLDIGPRIKETVPDGQVEIEPEELFEN